MGRRFAFFKLTLIMLGAGFSSNGYCWGALGHQIVGAVADERMSPEGKAFMMGVLGIESASIAAPWADAVRDDARFAHAAHDNNENNKDADDFDFSDYHFADVPSGFTYDTRPNKDLKDSFGAIKGALAILRDTSGKSTKPEKMIAMRYLIHLVGDIHQPLHVGNNHDIGANFCSVYWQKGTSPKNLHAVWDTEMVLALGDSLQGATKSAMYTPEYIAALKNLRADEFNAPKPSDVSLNAIKGWINESASIRENKLLAGNSATAVRDIGVYPEKPGDMSAYPGTEYKHRAYCMWFADTRSGVFGDTSPKRKTDIPQSVIPRLDDTYININTKIVERQIITGGIRLAALIDDLARATANDRQTPISEAIQNAIIISIQTTFHNPQ